MIDRTSPSRGNTRAARIQADAATAPQRIERLPDARRAAYLDLIHHGQHPIVFVLPDPAECWMRNRPPTFSALTCSTIRETACHWWKRGNITLVEVLRSRVIAFVLVLTSTNSVDPKMSNHVSRAMTCSHRYAVSRPVLADRVACATVVALPEPVGA